MEEVEPMKIDGAEKRKLVVDGSGQTKKSQKRKRVESSLCAPNPEEKEAKIKSFRTEIDCLVKFCKENVMENNEALLENAKSGSPASLNVVIACFMEESNLPLSKLVDKIFDGVKGRLGNTDGVTKAIVKSSVLKIGQRLPYGMTSDDADILEDENGLALWCWETRDLKLIPKLARGTLKVRRNCRKKIQERVAAVFGMINALEKLNDQNSLQELTKASEKLGKVLNMADIQLSMDNLLHKSSAEMAEKKAKKEEKLLKKQMEKNQREMEKEKKRKDKELEKEKLQIEKEQKRLQDEAEKEKRRREKEENEMQKKLKKQQEEAERCQKRKEKENSELRNQLSLQKQASLMDRFLKRNKTNPTSQSESSMDKETMSVSSSKNFLGASESVTQAMDSVLAQISGVEVEDIWKSHLNSWRCNGCSHASRKVHWGIRQKPKTELIKELKLTTNKEVTGDEDLNIEKLVDGWDDSSMGGRLSQMNTDSNPVSSSQKRPRVKQLLQFDKSYRPAFYGVWPKKSQAVGSRHPFVKDQDIEYDVDSDEEWEEEEPGESLSDCDKDEEDENMEEPLKDDEDEDESEDGFFVPDGYLSENEGVEMNCDDLVEEQQVQSEEFCTLLRQQKHLHNLTEHALKKNQPLIILNLMHEKTALPPAHELAAAEKLERMCLQALSICPLPGFSDIRIPVATDVLNEDQEASSNKLGSAPSETASAITDSDLPAIVSAIQAASDSIRKIVKSLHTQFPSVPKSQLKKKVHEISEYSDNRWQVKKEILNKLRLNVSPEKSYGKVKSIATYLKRCLPPSGKAKNLHETPSQSSQKPDFSQHASVEH